MTRLAVALIAAFGVYYVYTALVFGWRGLAVAPDVGGATSNPRTSFEQWLVQAGLDEVNRAEFLAVVTMLSIFGCGLVYALFGGIVPALLAGGFAATFPVASYKARRRSRRERAREAWPRMLEEIRLLTSSVGRSVPQALFEVGERAPTEMRSAFEAAHREWLLSTDFAKTITVLKRRLGDATADVTCETLLTAHELGGSDLGRRLDSLIEDRIQDTQGRKDAASRQAGARFARFFVLLVPIGMAGAGMSIGNGRAAYRTASGQMVVVGALILIVACWFWAGRIMGLPDEQRVFVE
ncbi:MAG: hypothetical protein V3V01_15115 [Acidimicrobiales bacterium]